MSKEPSREPIRILHLSDIHLRARTAWDSDPVLRALNRTIAEEVRADLLPDLVAITGDLAFSGHADDYDQACEWLAKQLWPVLTPEGSDLLPRDRLLLVPGNHDVDRGSVDFIAEATQKALLAPLDQDQIAKLLADHHQREFLFKRHGAYLDLYGDWLDEPQSLPWWQRGFEIRGKRLYCAGLDSAWMACGDSDRGQLLLGRYQVNQTVMSPEAEDADWRLALMHHPWDYLAEADGHEARETIHLQRDILLRGHLHEPESYRVVPADPRRACLELAAGSLYDGSRYPNSYQWIELHADPRRVRVLFRTWIKGEWVPNRNQPGADGDGAVVFPMEIAGPGVQGRAAAKASPAAIPAEYLAWLARTWSGVDLLGQAVQQGQSIQLRQVYCPAITALPAPDAEEAKENRAAGREAPVLPDPSEKQSPPSLLLARLNERSLYCPAAPGAGKSTFCRWAVLQSIPGMVQAHPVSPPEGYAEPVPPDLRRRLPLLVPLREFWRVIDCGHGRRSWCRADLERALGEWIDDSPPDRLTGALLAAHLAQGSALLLLDGLDEVPVSVTRDRETLYPRVLLLSGLADALPHWEERGNRTLLTSRPYGLDETGLARLALPSAPLEPLPEPLQRLFVERWFHTLDQPALAEGLKSTLGEREDLAPLAENPMLLTALCVIYGNGRRLPEDRYHLYERIVENVLYNRYPGDASQREPVKARLEAIAHGMHTGAGLDEERSTPQAQASDAELERILAAFARHNPAYEQGRVTPAVQREELLTRSGLLLPRSNGRAAFYHLSIQEHLAAERIARTCEDRAAWERVFRERGPVPEWRATLLFLFAAGVFQYRSAQWGLDLLGSLAADLGRAEVQANPALAVLVAEAIELCLAKGYAIPEPLREGFTKTCLAAIDDEIAIPARHSLGLCLGRLGDPRIHDLRDPAAYVEVPAGDYVYGKDNEPIRIETPFLLSRYPVTNSQYKAFIEAGGYGNRDWWSEEGWQWLQQEGVREPGYWQRRRWSSPSQPVVGISFWEADACCRWAGGRLPSEQEWEAATRGPDGCEYPWCGPWEDGICNSDSAGIGSTSAVGLFPRSRQAGLGIEDLAGNCWEWCASLLGRSGTTAIGAPRVLRGGAFISRAEFLRASFRFGVHPGVRGRFIGFRCVLAPRRQPRPIEQSTLSSQRTAQRSVGD